MHFFYCQNIYALYWEAIWWCCPCYIANQHLGVSVEVLSHSDQRSGSVQFGQNHRIMAQTIDLPCKSENLVCVTRYNQIILWSWIANTSENLVKISRVRNSARIHSHKDSCQQNCKNLNGFSQLFQFIIQSYTTRIQGFLQNSTGRIQIDSHTWSRISDPD